MKDLWKVRFEVDGDDIDFAKEAVDLLPDEFLEGSRPFRVTYSSQKKRCSISGVDGGSLESPLHFPEGVGDIDVYSPEGVGLRGKVAFSIGDFEYVVDPNKRG
jgi:hypothetical protein